MSQKKPFVERRKFRRIHPKNPTFTVGATRSGLVTEISMDGMTIHYFDRKSWPEETHELGIVVDDPLAGDSRLCLNGLPFRTVSDNSLPQNLPDSSPSVKRRGVQFGAMTAEQHAALENFICQMEGEQHRRHLAEALTAE